MHYSHSMQKFQVQDRRGVRRQSGKYKLYVMEGSGTWKINTDKEGYFCRYDSDFSMANWTIFTRIMLFISVRIQSSVKTRKYHNTKTIYYHIIIKQKIYRLYFYLFECNGIQIINTPNTKNDGELCCKFWRQFPEILRQIVTVSIFPRSRSWSHAEENRKQGSGVLVLVLAVATCHHWLEGKLQPDAAAVAWILA